MPIMNKVFNGKSGEEKYDEMKCSIKLERSKNRNMLYCERKKFFFLLNEISAFLCFQASLDDFYFFLSCNEITLLFYAFKSISTSFDIS